MSEPRLPEAPDERDAWLHQALRHAPDAAAAPPNALRESILAQARSAVQLRPLRAAEPPFLVRVSAFWSWLARPPVAASFASVVAATLVGMMWWDRPMDETSWPAPASSPRVVGMMWWDRPIDETSWPGPASSPRVVGSTPALPASQPAPLATDAPVLPPPAPVTQTAAAPPPPDGATSRRAVALPAKTAPAAADAAKSRKDEPTSIPPPSAPPASPFPGNGSSESGALAILRDERRQAAPSIAKKAESEPANDTQAGGSVAALAKPASPARERAAAARRDTTDTADALSASAAAAPQAFAAAPPAAPAPEREGVRAAAKTSPRPMAALLASIAQGAARWSQRAASGAKPLDTSAQAWLAIVDTATAGRWQSAADRDTRLESAVQAPAFAVLLDRDGRAAATIRVEDAGVFFQQEPGAAWFAPLPADEIASLRTALPR